MNATRSVLLLVGLAGLATACRPSAQEASAPPRPAEASPLDSDPDAADRAEPELEIQIKAPEKVAAGIHILAANSVSASPDNPAKYANTAIPFALETLGKKGIS